MSTNNSQKAANEQVIEPESAAESIQAKSLVFPGYSRILVPHDGSEMSDKALAHGIYLAKTSDAELVILHVLEDVGEAKVTSLDVSTTEEATGGNESSSHLDNKDLKVTLEGQGMRMIEDKIRICKENGIKHVSYKVQLGNPGEEIIKLSQEVDFDLLVMASKRITSRILGSTTRKVIDACKRATLIIPEHA
jgi:nucleotide-binding universal stress UspA family protein